jgi:ketosteroid isomerase-like protein
MKKNILFFLMLGFVFLIIGCEEQGPMPQEATNEDMSEIESLEKGGYWGGHYGSKGILLIPKFYSQALETGDTELYMALWDENGIQLPPDAPYNIGVEAIRAGVEPLMADFDMTMDITVIEARAVSDNWGYMWGTYYFTGTPKGGGEGFSVDGKFSTIVKKRYKHDRDRRRLGPWKVYIDCFNSNVP